MRTKRLAKVLLLVTVFTIALYGCGGNKENTESKTPANDQSLTEPTEAAKSELPY